jgi:hypothetical protein
MTSLSFLWAARVVGQGHAAQFASFSMDAKAVVFKETALAGRKN